MSNDIRTALERLVSEIKESGHWLAHTDAFAAARAALAAAPEGEGPNDEPNVDDVLKLASAPAGRGGGGMSQSLSPAAQAVLDAVCGNTESDCDTQHLIAASLRAVADQVVPAEQPEPRRGMRPGGTGALSPDEGAEDQRAATRRKLLAIAAELEGSDA